MRILLDEMYDPGIAAQLRDRMGIDVRELGEQRGMSDEDLFEAAIADWRSIVTENVSDFVPLASAAIADGRDIPGLVFTSNRAFPRAKAATSGAIVRSLIALSGERLDLTNQMIWLKRVR